MVVIYQRYTGHVAVTGASDILVLNKLYNAWPAVKLGYIDGKLLMGTRPCHSQNSLPCILAAHPMVYIYYTMYTCRTSSGVYLLNHVYFLQIQWCIFTTPYIFAVQPEVHMYYTMYTCRSISGVYLLH